MLDSYMKLNEQLMHGQPIVKSLKTIGKKDIQLTIWDLKKKKKRFKSLGFIEMIWYKEPFRFYAHLVIDTN